MRSIQSLVHARTRVSSRYALMPLEGFPSSRLPSFPDATNVRVLASPQLGAQFVQYLIDLPAGGAGGFDADPALETFYYVLSGSGRSADGVEKREGLRAGSFGLLPPGQRLSLVSESAMQLLVVRKRYEPAPGLELFGPLHGHEADVAQTTWADDEGALLQTLIPDELKYDLAMNIFTFAPGHGLPVVETHVMEHGALILQGKGVYYLDGTWMEVEQDDFIWMGSYCPQSFYAAGTVPAKYIYYKNVNREIPL